MESLETSYDIHTMELKKQLRMVIDGFRSRIINDLSFFQLRIAKTSLRSMR